METQPKFPKSTPTTSILWPSDGSHHTNQLQQQKSYSVPQVSNVLPTTQPSRPSVSPRTTPKHVRNVRVVTRTVAGQKNVTVAFVHPGGDKFFQGARVYLKRAGKNPVQVAAGSKSPLTFSVPNTPIPHSIVVTSVGPSGESDLLSSPSARVRLS